jgi:hypothetical protein
VLHEFVHPPIHHSRTKKQHLFCLVLNFEEFSEGATGTITTLYDQTATTPCLSFYQSSPLTDNTLSPAWDMRVYHFTFSFFFVDAYTLYEYTAFTREGGKRSQDPGTQVHRRYPVTLLHGFEISNQKSINDLHNILLSLCTSNLIPSYSAGTTMCRPPTPRKHASSHKSCHR